MDDSKGLSYFLLGLGIGVAVGWCSPRIRRGNSWTHPQQSSGRRRLSAAPQ